MDLIKASVTTVTPSLTVTIDGSNTPISGNLISGAPNPAVGVLCWLLFPPGNLPPLVLVPV